MRCKLPPQFPVDLGMLRKNDLRLLTQECRHHYQHRSDYIGNDPQNSLSASHLDEETKTCLRFYCAAHYPDPSLPSASANSYTMNTRNFDGDLRGMEIVEPKAPWILSARIGVFRRYLSFELGGERTGRSAIAQAAQADVCNCDISWRWLCIKCKNAEISRCAPCRGGWKDVRQVVRHTRDDLKRGYTARTELLGRVSINGSMP